MNYSDLYKEICALGFEKDIEMDEVLLFCARRAINEIYTERPVYKTAELYKNPIHLTQKINRILHGAGEDKKIAFNAKAYSFITSGIGTYTVKDTEGRRTEDFSGERIIHKGFIHGDGEIIFSGEFFYTVYDFALFSEIYSPTESDIPVYSDLIEFELKKYLPDFLVPLSAPRGEDGFPLQGARIEDGVMKIPSDYSGKIFLTYKKAPSVLIGEADEDIVLPDGCEHLLPLLVAAYFWLDDDSEKSQYYMSLYRDGMASVRVRGPSHVNNSYQNVNGWA